MNHDQYRTEAPPEKRKGTGLDLARKHWILEGGNFFFAWERCLDMGFSVWRWWGSIPISIFCERLFCIPSFYGFPILRIG